MCLLEWYAVTLLLLGWLLHSFDIEVFFIQVNKDMVSEIDGIIGVLYLFDDIAFLIEATADGLHFFIREDSVQFLDGIVVFLFSFRREGHQIRPVYLEYLAEQFHFFLAGRVKLFYETDAVVAVNHCCRFRRQGSGLTVKVDDTFLYIGMLFLEFLEDFALGRFWIKGEQLVYEGFDTVKTLFRCRKVQKFFNRQDSGSVNNFLVGMVYQHIAVGFVFLAEEDDVYSEVLLHFLLQFFLIGAYVQILFQVGSELAVACFVLVVLLEQGFYFCYGEFLLDSSALFDIDLFFFLEDFVAHGGHDGFELGKGGEAVLLGCMQVIFCFLFSICSKYLVYYDL
ncbi:membrane protein [gut metagenome]|uniref:Membrane protein n=1 Tax=gut metagenome TaxID=749906 RepID=J9GGJ2_9ZZZZ